MTRNDCQHSEGPLPAGGQSSGHRDSMPLHMHIPPPTVKGWAKEVPIVAHGGAAQMLPYRRASHERLAIGARRTPGLSLSIAHSRLPYVAVDDRR